MSDLHANYQAYLELQKEIEALQAKATLLMMEGRAKALEDITGLIKVYDIRADEIGFPVLPKRVRKPEKKRDRTPKGAPKYRDPDSGTTWTGAGKPPNWIIGKDYADFLIDAPREQAQALPVRETDPAAASLAAAWPVPGQTG